MQTMLMFMGKYELKTSSEKVKHGLHVTKTEQKECDEKRDKVKGQEHICSCYLFGIIKQCFIILTGVSPSSVFHFFFASMNLI